MSHIRLFFLLLSVVPIIGVAQLENKQAYIEGYVYDAEEKAPIPFATIKVKGWAKGVVTNRNGSFKVPKKFSELSDTLIVTSMGYETKVVSIHQMIARKSNVIFLNPHVYGLEETVLYASKKKKRKLSARSIVRKAIRAIPDNYPNQPFSLTGYYRDYQWHENDYLNLNEAILSIYDKGFESKDQQSTQFALHSILVNENFPRDTISNQPYDYENRNKVINNAILSSHGGNELRILRVHDAIRNYEVNSYAFVYKLKSQFLSGHSFERAKDIFLDDLPFYNITVTKSQNGYEAFGQLLIDKENFSIYKLNYSLYFKDTNGKSVESIDGLEKDLIFEVLSEYRPFKDKMFLNYITFNNSFILPEPPRFFIEELLVNVVTRRLSLTFNNPVDEQKANIISNYELKFFGEPLTIKEVSLDVANPRTVLLFLEFKDGMKERDFYNYFKNYQTNKEAGAKLRCYVMNITDIHGNLVDKIYDYKEYQQFREFFTQEVQEDFETPIPSSFMDMNLPVFEKQPLQKKDDLENYWMNSPLKVVYNLDED
ncbi:carboxypeptidase-like regulatory domain-containing protein [Flagellimonas okinawensis]|uniref:Carboxypeptidase-like regulatory domain-containing protein n=1 Tax=Flagellimonas okinawensis TaxID=3031324 RepID=A0ABT5XSQ5_9FLAO|nr:carboxypeptidase-like regulatory domain-containing protein [[Muricauda] okinawensis]MDF0708910.1 carboxypeptidase-like regulatory domain-containing protein [[Muricauda] okinawensis]